MTKKILARALAIIMLTAVAVSCKKNTNTPQGSETPSDVVTDNNGGDDGDNIASETVAKDADTLEDIDLDGKKVNIVTRGTTEYEFRSEAGSKGTVVERAVYNREATVENRFNVDINIIPQKADWGDLSTFTEMVRAEYLSPSAGWQVLSVHSTVLARMVANGYLQDMNNFENIDMNKVWWSELLYKELNIDGKMYLGMGDINVTLYEYMQVMFFNETQLEVIYHGEGKDMLYKLVEDGEWTWEELKKMAALYGTGAEEAGGDGAYGFVMNAHALRATFASNEAKTETKDANGRIIYEDVPTERLTKTVEFLAEFLKQPNTQFPGGSGDSQSTQNKLFAAGKILFYPQVLQAAKTITATMTDAYAIVPYPKYDEYQDMYRTICKSSVSAVAIMSTVSEDADKLAVGTVVEALAMEGYKQVTPAYYNTVLKKQYFDDPKSAAILDDIRNGMTVQSVASLYTTTTIYPHMYQSSIINGTVDVTSTYTKKLESSRGIITDFYASMREMGLIQ